MTARQEWEALSEAQQLQLILGCTARAAKKRGIKLNPVDLAGEVFVTVTDTLESGKRLLFLCLNAADTAIRREYRKERKHEAAKAFEYITVNYSSVTVIVGYHHSVAIPERLVFVAEVPLI